VKKVIELLEEAKAALIYFAGKDIINGDWDKIIAGLKNPAPITPEQYREIEGEEYPKEGLVFFIEEGEDEDEVNSFYWEYETYSDYIFFHKGLPCVCACNLTRPPPAGWRPE
jgi:hypothetical protein